LDVTGSIVVNRANQTGLTASVAAGPHWVGRTGITATTNSGGQGNGAITWVSNNTSVATINATTGVVTFVGTGNVTFTATRAQSANHNAISATTASVNVVAATRTFALQSGNLNFGTMTFGAAIPAARTITIRNTGNTAIPANQYTFTMTAGTGRFTLTGVTTNTIWEPNTDRTFIVTPTANPPAGTHNVTIAVGSTASGPNVTPNPLNVTGSMVVNRASRTITPATSITILGPNAATVVGGGVTSPAGGTVQWGWSLTNDATTVTNWQASRDFTGLSPFTEYFFFARVLQDTNFNEARSTGVMGRTEFDESTMIVVQANAGRVRAGSMLNATHQNRLADADGAISFVPAPEALPHPGTWAVVEDRVSQLFGYDGDGFAIFATNITGPGNAIDFERSAWFSEVWIRPHRAIPAGFHAGVYTETVTIRHSSAGQPDTFVRFEITFEVIHYPEIPCRNPNLQGISTVANTVTLISTIAPPPGWERVYVLGSMRTGGNSPWGYIGSVWAEQVNDPIFRNVPAGAYVVGEVMWRNQETGETLPARAGMQRIRVVGADHPAPAAPPPPVIDQEVTIPGLLELNLRETVTPIGWTIQSRWVRVYPARTPIYSNSQFISAALNSRSPLEEPGTRWRVETRFVLSNNNGPILAASQWSSEGFPGSGDRNFHAAPNAPVLVPSDIVVDNVTITAPWIAVPTPPGFPTATMVWRTEYRLTDADGDVVRGWQTSRDFENLDPATEYILEVRFGGIVPELTHASPITRSEIITTDAATRHLVHQDGNLAFGEIIRGQAQPAERTITIRNTGNMSIPAHTYTATLGANQSANFIISGFDATTDWLPGTDRTITIALVGNRPAGTHDVVVTIASAVTDPEVDSIQVSGSFTVNNPPLPGTATIADRTSSSVTLNASTAAIPYGWERVYRVGTSAAQTDVLFSGLDANVEYAFQWGWRLVSDPAETLWGDTATVRTLPNNPGQPILLGSPGATSFTVDVVPVQPEGGNWVTEYRLLDASGNVIPGRDWGTSREFTGLIPTTSYIVAVRHTGDVANTGFANSTPATNSNVITTVTGVLGISLNPTAPIFADWVRGTPRPEAQTITITNDGNVEVTLSDAPANPEGWTIGDWPVGAARTLAPGETATFTIQPNANLVAGTYPTGPITVETVGVGPSNVMSTTIRVVNPTTPPTGSVVIPIQIGREGWTNEPGVSARMVSAAQTTNDGVSVVLQQAPPAFIAEAGWNAVVGAGTFTMNRTGATVGLGYHLIGTGPASPGDMMVDVWVFLSLCGEYPCECDPCDVCDQIPCVCCPITGDYPCECPCDTCDQFPCVCCPITGDYPCECDLCDTCGQDPCACCPITGDYPCECDLCDTCGQDPCVCCPITGDYPCECYCDECGKDPCECGPCGYYPCECTVITVDKDDDGTLTFTPELPNGSVVTTNPDGSITITVPPGYIVEEGNLPDGWTFEQGEDGRGGTLFPPDTDCGNWPCTCDDATFIATVASAQPARGSATIVSVGNSGEFAVGATVNISASAVTTPAPGYIFTHWSVLIGDVTIANATSATTSFVMPAGNVLVVANFVPAGTVTDRWQMLILEANPENPNHTLIGDGLRIIDRVTAIQATPAPGYRFVNWTTEADVVLANATSAVTTFVMPDSDVPVVITANFEYVGVGDQTRRNVIVNVAQPEWGRAFGSGMFAQGWSVAIDAVPNLGFRFTHWEVSTPSGLVVANDASTTFAMPGAVVMVTAHFEHDPDFEVFPVVVAVNSELRGSATGWGSFAAGARVRVEATANPGYDFVNWTVVMGGVVLENAALPTTYFTMPAGPVLLIANFEPSVIGGGWRLITVVSENPALGGVTGGGVFREGTSVGIQAVPTTGNRFIGWTVNFGGVTLANATSPSTSLIVPAANGVIVTAHFEPIIPPPAQEFTLTLGTAPLGRGVANGAGRFTQGATVMVQAVANQGFVFTGWTVDGTDITLANEPTVMFEMPGRNVTIIANFAVDPSYSDHYEVTVIGGTGGGYFAPGARVYIEAGAAPEDQMFLRWEVISGGVALLNPNIPVTSFIMPANDVVVEAIFGPIDCNCGLEPCECCPITGEYPCDCIEIIVDKDDDGTLTFTPELPDDSDVTTNPDGSITITVPPGYVVTPGDLPPGWTFTPDGEGGGTLNPPTEIVVDKDDDGTLTFTPQLPPGSDVTTNPDGSITITVPPGYVVTPGDLPPGWTFTPDGEGGGTLNPPTEIVVDKDDDGTLTFTPQLPPGSDVTTNPDGSITITVPPGYVVTPGDLPPGWTFIPDGEGGGTLNPPNTDCGNWPCTCPTGPLWNIRIYGLPGNGGSANIVGVGNNRDFAAGTPIRVQATPATGFRFERWDASGNITNVISGGTNVADTTFAMPSGDAWVRAIFVPIDGDCDNCGYDPCRCCPITGDYPCVCDEICDNCNQDPCVCCPITGDYPCECVDPAYYTVEIVVHPVGGGTAVVVGTATRRVGTQVPVQATPADGFRFVRWNIIQGALTDGEAYAASTSFTMPVGNVILEAVFEPIGVTAGSLTEIMEIVPDSLNREDATAGFFIAVVDMRTLPGGFDPNMPNNFALVYNGNSGTNFQIHHSWQRSNANGSVISNTGTHIFTIFAPNASGAGMWSLTDAMINGFEFVEVTATQPRTPEMTYGKATATYRWDGNTASSMFTYDDVTVWRANEGMWNNFTGVRSAMNVFGAPTMVEASLTQMRNRAAAGMPLGSSVGFFDILNR